MKKIGLLSDTHAYFDDRYFEYFTDCDEIWHAGDIGSIPLADKFEKFKPIRFVSGNIDGIELRKQFPLVQRFVIEGVEVLLTHIGGYPGKSAPAIIPEFIKSRPQLFICVHAQILK